MGFDRDAGFVLRRESKSDARRWGARPGFPSGCARAVGCGGLDGRGDIGRRRGFPPRGRCCLDKRQGATRRGRARPVSDYRKRCREWKKERDERRTAAGGAIFARDKTLRWEITPAAPYPSSFLSLLTSYCMIRDYVCLISLRIVDCREGMGCRAATLAAMLVGSRRPPRPDPGGSSRGGGSGRILPGSSAGDGPAAGGLTDSGAPPCPVPGAKASAAGPKRARI